MPILSSTAGLSCRGYGGGVASLAPNWVSYLTNSSAVGDQFGSVSNVAFDSDSNSYLVGTWPSGYVAKCNRFGILQWNKADPIVSLNNALDSSGNIYLAGAGSVGDSALAKLNSSGTVLWTKNLANSGSTKETIALDVTVDSSNNIYIAGYFNNGVNTTAKNAFVAKYNNSGTLQWQRSLATTVAAGDRDEQATGVRVDSSGNVYITGSYISSVLNSYYGTFIVKYNSSGTIQWQRSLADTGQPYTKATGLVLDSLGNVYINGSYYDGSTGLAGFLAKYNASGIIQWQKSLSNVASSPFAYSDVHPLGLAVDSSDNIYSTGYFRNSTGTNEMDGFVVKYNSSGVALWQRGLSDSNVGAGKQTYSQGIGIDPFGEMYLVGRFTNSADGQNAFVAKFPNDGTKTGTRTFDIYRAVNYYSSSITTGTPTMTDAAGALTSATSTLTDTSSTTTTYDVAIVTGRINF